MGASNSLYLSLSLSRISHGFYYTQLRGAWRAPVLRNSSFFFRHSRVHDLYVIYIHRKHIRYTHFQLFRVLLVGCRVGQRERGIFGPSFARGNAFRFLEHAFVDASTFNGNTNPSGHPGVSVWWVRKKRRRRIIGRVFTCSTLDGRKHFADARLSSKPMFKGNGTVWRSRATRLLITTL